MEQENIRTIKVSGGSAGTTAAGSTYAKTELHLLNNPAVRIQNLNTK